MWGSGAAFSSREGALPFGACGAKARPAGGAAALSPQQRPGYRIRLLPGAPRPRPRFSACRSGHGPGRKRGYAIEPGRSVYGSWGALRAPRHACGDPPQSSGGKTAGTCAPVHRIRPWLRQRRAASANKKAPNGSFVCFNCYRIRLGTKCNASAEVKWYSVSPYIP